MFQQKSQGLFAALQRPNTGTLAPNSAPNTDGKDEDDKAEPTTFIPN